MKLAVEIETTKSPYNDDFFICRAGLVGGVQHLQESRDQRKAIAYALQELAVEILKSNSPLPEMDDA